MQYSALVIAADKEKPLGDLLAIASAEAKKKHGLAHDRVDVVDVLYSVRLSVFVALYRSPDVMGGRAKSEK